MDEALFSRIATISINAKDKQIIYTTKDILWNQLKRDTPKIAESFDRLFAGDVDQMGELFGQVVGLVLEGMRRGNRLQDVCNTVLFNTINTYFSALSLLREGHKLQPLMLIRSVVESISVVLHIIMKPDDLTTFEKGTLKSTKCVTSAKNVIPFIGELYGHLSNTVTHIAELHRKLHLLREYEARDEAVSTNLGYLKLTIWLTYITSELLNIDLLATPRYWSAVGENGFQFKISDEEGEWLDEFFGRLEDSGEEPGR